MNAVAAEQCAETYGETLAERMERGPLPVGEALRYAIQIARYLRDLHAQGLVYGAVSSHLIVLAPSGACLRPSGGVAHLGDRRDDVAAFGGVLREILPALQTSDSRDAMAALARHCEQDTPDIRHVTVALRLIALRMRHRAAGVRRPGAARRPEPSAIRRKRVRLRIRMTLRWKPLVNLAALALSGG